MVVRPRPFRSGVERALSAQWEAPVMGGLKPVAVELFPVKAGLEKEETCDKP